MQSVARKEMCETTEKKPTNTHTQTIITILIWMEHKKNETCGVQLPPKRFLCNQLETYVQNLKISWVFSWIESIWNECVCVCVCAKFWEFQLVKEKKLFRLNHHFLALSFTINFLGIILSAIKVEFFICEWHNAWSCMHAFVWMLAKRVCTSPNGSKKKSTSFDHAIIFTANFSYQIFETVTTAKKPAFVS